MSDRLFNYIGEMLRGCLDVDLAAARVIDLDPERRALHLRATTTKASAPIPSATKTLSPSST